MSDQPMSDRDARRQVDTDRAAGRTTPHEVLVLASGDRTIEPILDGRGHPIEVDDPDADGGRRPLRLAEACRGDQWARDSALRHGHHPTRDEHDRHEHDRDEQGRNEEQGRDDRERG